MADLFLGLSANERIEALEAAATSSGRPAHVLEKGCVGRLDAFDSL